MTLAVPFYLRLGGAPFPVRALVGLLTLTVALSLKSVLDVACGYLHASPLIADVFFYTASTPIVVPLIVPMVSFLAPLFNGKRSTRPQQSWQRDHFRRADDASTYTSWQDDDEVWDSWREQGVTADWHTDREYAWFPGNVHHDHS